MPYGVSDSTWKRLSRDEQAAIEAGWRAAEKPPQPAAQLHPVQPVAADSAATRTPATGTGAAIDTGSGIIPATALPPPAPAAPRPAASLHPVQARDAASTGPGATAADVVLAAPGAHIPARPGVTIAAVPRAIPNSGLAALSAAARNPNQPRAASSDALVPPGVHALARPGTIPRAIPGPPQTQTAKRVTPTGHPVAAPTASSLEELGVEIVDPFDSVASPSLRTLAAQRPPASTARPKLRLGTSVVSRNQATRDPALSAALVIFEATHPFLGLPAAAGTRASAISAALRGGSSAAGHALPAAGAFARTLEPASDVAKTLGEATPFITAGLAYAQALATGTTPNEAMAEAAGAVLGSAAGEGIGVAICAIPGVGTVGCVVALPASVWVGGQVGEKVGAGIYTAAVWLGSVIP